MKTQDYLNWYMEIQELGCNYRINDFQFALGLSQLLRANEWIQRRRGIAEWYFRAFEGEGFNKAQSGVIEGPAYHLYVIDVEDRFGYNYLR